MRNLLTIILCSIPLFLIAQETEQNTYTMFQTVYLNVDKSKTKEFGAAMRAHNQKFHKDGPYTAGVWSITTGPDSDKLVWMMGPCTFSHLDARTDMEAHGKDWRENVIAHTTEVGNVEFWKRKDEWSKPSDTFFPIVRVRYLVVAKNQGYRIDGLLTKLKETIIAMGNNNSFEIYENQFRQGSRGRHFSIVTGFNKWGELDENREFVKNFEKKHGADTYQNWSKEMEEVFSDAYDEFWNYVPLLSGDDN